VSGPCTYLSVRITYATDYWETRLHSRGNASRLTTVNVVNVNVNVNIDATLTVTVTVTVTVLDYETYSISNSVGDCLRQAILT
jgi:hypothetical protein